MSVIVETTLGDITVDLFLKERPQACFNFLKLCKMKYFNYNLFHTISRGFIAQTGDPTGSRSGGESIYAIIDNDKSKKYVEAEFNPKIKHTKMGLISFVCNEDRMMSSQFFFTLGDDLSYLDNKHCVFGEVVEGSDVLEIMNEAICCPDERPYQDIRITHTVVLDDPFPDPKDIKMPSRSPSPSAERLQGGRIPADEEIDDSLGKSLEEVNEMVAEREAKARATILEMVGDIPDAEMAPPENVLFVCKLNPVTSDDDLEIIFGRFGKIRSCEVIRDRKTGDSLQYAFIEFEEKRACEEAYFKMDNVLIDDRRIHVDFSQSVSKMKWLGKGRGVRYYNEDEEEGEGMEEKDSVVRRERRDGKDRKSFTQSKSFEKNRKKSRSRSPDRTKRHSKSTEKSTTSKFSEKSYRRNPDYKRRSRSRERQSSSMSYTKDSHSYIIDRYNSKERRCQKSTTTRDEKHLIKNISNSDKESELKTYKNDKVKKPNKTDRHSFKTKRKEHFENKHRNRKSDSDEDVHEYKSKRREGSHNWDKYKKTRCSNDNDKKRGEYEKEQTKRRKKFDSNSGSESSDKQRKKYSKKKQERKKRRRCTPSSSSTSSSD